MPAPIFYEDSWEPKCSGDDHWCVYIDEHPGPCWDGTVPDFIPCAGLDFTCVFADGHDGRCHDGETPQMMAHEWRALEAGDISWAHRPGQQESRIPGHPTQI